MKLLHFLNPPPKTKPKLYLHAGTHKTGTTALQEFAASHRRQLLQRGIFYPKLYSIIIRPQIAHHWFAHVLAGLDNIPITTDSLVPLTRKWAAKAGRKGADIFISAEAFYRHLSGEGKYGERRRNYLMEVGKFLTDFNVNVILVFRRPDDYIRSLYQERVMRAARPLPPFQKFYQTNPKGLEYHLNARLFKEVFPNLTCLIYEDLAVENGFFTNFFRTMGVDVSDLNSVGVVRKSLSPAETMVKNFANRYLENRDAGKIFLSWMRKPQIVERIKDAYGDTEYALWPSHAARQEFCESRQEDLEKLRRNFFPDRERLFPELREEETAPQVPPLPEELKRMVLDYFGRKAE